MPIDLAYSCHYCHSTQGTNFLATERMLGLGREFAYATCATCNSLQLTTVPKDLSYYYPKEILFDSTAFQFWETGLYERMEKLGPSKIGTYFSSKRLEKWEQQAIQYNLEGNGDQACFFCVKAGRKVEGQA
jgi:hypothetical protein